VLYGTSLLEIKYEKTFSCCRQARLLDVGILHKKSFKNWGEIIEILEKYF
jgi:hypothetical protein